jgi:hypothetical protein
VAFAPSSRFSQQFHVCAQIVLISFIRRSTPSVFGYPRKEREHVRGGGVCGHI